MKKTQKTILFFIITFFSAIVCIGCKNNQPLSQTGFLLDTVITITIYQPNATESVLDDAFSCCSQYENMLSKTISGSEIYQINHANGKTVVVSNETADLIRSGIQYGNLSNGLFDITIGTASDLWDFKGDGKVPDQNVLSEAISHVDYHSIKISGNEVSLLDDKAEIDLGGIAKGYIADRIKDLLIKQGIQSAVINLGGNVLTIGEKPDGSPFEIGIQKPFAAANEIATTVSVSDSSVVSSGSYERNFTKNGILYHHILDPHTGYPIQNHLTGVTILSDHSVDGDALSTTCFLLGKEKGKELIESLPGIDAIFISDDGSIEQTYSNAS